jgi:8-oxo-dGTP diphosphatase
MRNATLCFPIRGNPAQEILLGFKKIGLGAGKYNGFGGKVERGETVTVAAARELEEEAGLKVVEQDLQQMGHLTFLFPAKPSWNQVVHVFLAAAWDGTPIESAEMVPAWFAVDAIPFERMWQDDAHWLPRVLAGERVWARFTFNDDNETIDEMEIKTGFQ